MRRDPPRTSLGPWLPRRPRPAQYLDLMCGTFENYGWIKRQLVFRGDWRDPFEELDLRISTGHPSYAPDEPERFLARAERKRMTRFIYDSEGHLTNIWVFRAFDSADLARFIAVWIELPGDDDIHDEYTFVADGRVRYVWRCLDYIVEWPRLRGLFTALFHHL